MTHRVLSALTVSLLGLGGCSEPGQDEQEVPVLVVHASDYSFAAPDTARAGWVWLRLVNQSESLHHVQVYRIPAETSADQFFSDLPAAEPMPSTLEALGGPEGADDPRVEVQAAVHLSPGDYALVCRFETQEGVLHMHEGMTHHLTVVAVPGRDQVDPWMGVRDTIWLQDFSFALSDGIRAGTRDFVVVNRGPSEHHVAIGRLRPGMGLEDVLASYSDPAAPEAYDVVGGTAGIGPGVQNVARANLEPGRHVLVCFIVDPVTGMEHVQLSMVRVFDVT